PVRTEGDRSYARHMRECGDHTPRGRLPQQSSRLITRRKNVLTIGTKNCRSNPTGVGQAHTLFWRGNLPYTSCMIITSSDNLPGTAAERDGNNPPFMWKLSNLSSARTLPNPGRVVPPSGG